MPRIRFLAEVYGPLKTEFSHSIPPLPLPRGISGLDEYEERSS
jgi:hypothetical protein